jgi:uncharacterized protein (DUF433 family)
MTSLKDVIVKDPDILGGTPVFRGTRVPLQALFDSIEGGETLEEFLEGFPSVSREMAVAALEQARELLSKVVALTQQNAASPTGASPTGFPLRHMQAILMTILVNILKILGAQVRSEKDRPTWT